MVEEHLKLSTDDLEQHETTFVSPYRKGRLWKYFGFVPMLAR